MTVFIVLPSLLVGFGISSEEEGGEEGGEGRGAVSAVASQRAREVRQSSGDRSCRYIHIYMATETMRYQCIVLVM